MHKRNLILTVSLFLLCSAVTVSAQQQRRGRAKPRPIDVVGTYSSMDYDNESGDAGGATVIISAASNEQQNDFDYFAVVQFAEGVPEAPVLVRAKITGTTVTFSVPSGGEETRYIARVSAAGMTLKINMKDGADFGLLKRKTCR